MKVIDLINDLFDYREFQLDKLPKKIRFNNNEFVFKDNSYYHENGISIMRYVDHTLDLRVEVEIIEEDKEIEEINKSYPIFAFDKKSFEAMKDMLQDVYEKQSEIIEAVNELKKGK